MWVWNYHAKCHCGSKNLNEFEGQGGSGLALRNEEAIPGVEYSSARQRQDQSCRIWPRIGRS